MGGLAQPVTWTGCHTETGLFSQRPPGPRARPVSRAHDPKLRAEAQALGPSTPRRLPKQGSRACHPRCSRVHVWTPGHPRAPHPCPPLCSQWAWTPTHSPDGGASLSLLLQGPSSSQPPPMTSRLTCVCSYHGSQKGSCNKGFIFSIYNEPF